jgi:hypothetical protein
VAPAAVVQHHLAPPLLLLLVFLLLLLPFLFSQKRPVAWLVHAVQHC